jgi:hypothetical protein
MSRHYIHQHGKKVASRLLAMVLLGTLLLSACQTDQKNRFPILTTTTASATTIGNTPTDAPSTGAPITLRVAGPFTAETAEALRQLYLNIQSGQLKRSDGVTIGDRFKPGGAIPDDASLTIRFEPISLAKMQDGSAYREMAAKGTLPDVFATGDAGSLAQQNAILDLTPALNTLDAKSATRIPVFALEAMRSNGRILGVPYLATVPLLIYNRSLAEQLGQSIPSERMSAVDFTDILLRTSDLLQQKSRPPVTPTVAPTAAPPGPTTTPTRVGPTTATTHAGPTTAPTQAAPTAAPTQPIPTSAPNPFLAISAIADLRPLLKYWPSSIDTTLGYGAFQKGSFRFDASAVSETLQLMRELDRNQMMPSLAIAKAGAVNQTEARSNFRNGQSLFLIEDSGSLPDWYVQSSVPTVILDLPLGKIAAAKTRAMLSQPTSAAAPRVSPSPTKAGTGSVIDVAAARQAFQMTAYCVSAKTTAPATAARFALFLAQDPDALMLQNQYQSFEGYVPLSHDHNVWDRFITKQMSGYLLQPYEQRLYRGYASPAIVQPNFEKVLAETIMNPERFIPEASVQPADLKILNEIAANRLKEGS